MPLTFYEIRMDRGIPFTRAREIEAQWLEDVKALRTEEQRAREAEAIRRRQQLKREREESSRRMLAELKKAPKRTTRGAAKAGAAGKGEGEGEEVQVLEDEVEEPEEEEEEEQEQEQVRPVWCGRGHGLVGWVDCVRLLDRLRCTGVVP